MDIRVNRDVLYFAVSNKFKNITIHKKDAPRHTVNGLPSIEETKDKNRTRKRSHKLFFMKKQNKGCPYLFYFGKRQEQGSLTVEAAFCATAFFLVFMTLFYLLLFVEDLNRQQIRMAKTVQRYSCYGERISQIPLQAKESMVLLWDTNKKICYTQRKREVPFLGSLFFHTTLYQQMKYSTYEGKTIVPQGKENVVYVYVAPHGTVYHKIQDCVYLNPGITKTTYGKVEGLRNISGGKYKPCKSCVKKGEQRDESVVFVTPYGDSYHITKNCSGIKRGIRKIPIEEIGRLRPCSKCGK